MKEQKPEAPAKSNIKYPYEIRVKAVKMAEEEHLTRRKIAQQLGLCGAPMVTKWVKIAREKGYETLMTRQDRIKMREGIETDPPPEDIDELKRQNAELKLDKAVLEETIKVLKKDPGIGHQALSNKEKATVIDAMREKGYRLGGLLIALAIAKSSYEYQRCAAARPDKYAELRIRITEIFNKHKARWGSERIWAELRKGDKKHAPIFVSEKVVRRLMADENLAVVYVKGKRNYCSYQGDQGERPDNLVGRNFHSEKPNMLWLTDITQFTLPSFKCYLSPIIDCFDGKVVSHKLSLSPNAELVNSMLDEAVATITPEDRPVCLSDGGIHYWWPGWISRCDAAGITRSMSKKACSPDNSACEGFFGRLKNEFFYYVDWGDITFDEFSGLLNDYIVYYNENRIKKSLGWLSPNEYRRSLKLAA